MSLVDFGLFAINMYACSRPDELTRVARAAEEAGFDSLWAGEHVVLPDPQVPPSPMAPQDPALDPIVALTLAAAVTERVRLATGIIILPQRNPVVRGKPLASLDGVAVGRLVFGGGVGYLQPEFAAIGAPFADRGARSLEYLAAMRALWEQEQPAFRGRYVAFEGVDAHPRPLQRPVPVVMGGHSEAAFRRSVEHAHGWYGFALSQEDAAACLAGLAAAAARYERPASLGPLELTITPRGRVTPDRLEQWQALGIDRLVVVPQPAATVEDILRLIEETPTDG